MIAERHASRFTAFRIRLARIISVTNWRRRYYHICPVNWPKGKRGLDAYSPISDWRGTLIFEFQSGRVQ
jgi:hypothetical protein